MIALPSSSRSTAATWPSIAVFNSSSDHRRPTPEQGGPPILYTTSPVPTVTGALPPLRRARIVLPEAASYRYGAAHRSHADQCTSYLFSFDL